MAQPFVSVLIDTYNHEKFIEQAVTSVLEQDFPASDREILVVDDGSTDGTPELVRKFAPRVAYLPKQNGGQASAFNHGIPRCRGEIVAFLDGDDWWLPQKLTRVVEAFRANPEVGMVGHGIIDSFEDRSEVITKGRTELFRRDAAAYAELFRLSRAFLGTSRLALRADIARKILPVAGGLIFEADEYLFTLAAALADFMILAEPLSHYRIHGSNLFVAGGGSRAGLRRKQQVLHVLLNSLRSEFASRGVAASFANPVLEIVSFEEAQLRLTLDGGSPLETYRTETGIYRIQHADAPWRSKFLRACSMLPAMLLPPRAFYAARAWLSSQGWYKKARRSIVPVPTMTKVPK